MLRTLPFNALRTLESVVRLRGFGRAAQELNITQSAVSQHVKQLEQWLGHDLLIRRGRQTIPTEAGQQLAAATLQGFGMIETLCSDLQGRKRREDRGILVASPPGFAFVWILPRLLEFDAQHPDIPVSLSTEPQTRDRPGSEADLYISYSAGGFPGLHAEKLMSEQMSPVCTPEIAASLRSVEDLSRFIILQDALDAPGAPSNWDVWAREVDRPLPHFRRVRRFGQANLVIQAAISGQGVAMGRGPLVEDAVRDGRLVFPFKEFAVSQFSYWFVCPHESLRSKSVQAFRQWLLAQAKSQHLGALAHQT